MWSGIERGTFELLSPSRYLSFSFPNPNPHLPNPYADPLRLAVLDSPHPDPNHPKLAALLVPRGRESDWIFSTFAGHLQLLLSSSTPSFPISRLVLIGDDPPLPDFTHYTRPDPDSDPTPILRFQRSLRPLLLAVAPKAAFRGGIPEIPFLSYEDDVVRIATVDRVVGPVVGEMVVEDVDVAGEQRRRLRFKRMPNLVQSQVRVLEGSRPEMGSLVQPYLRPMVAGLSLVGRIDLNLTIPKALCVGVGGGALHMSLRMLFGFDVLGVEADEMVLAMAKRHFGLVEDELLKVCVGDGIELIEHCAQKLRIGDGDANVFDVIMVDLDSGDAASGVSAPPLQFVQRSVLMDARVVLSKQGALVVNVIPIDGDFYKRLVDAFREVFVQLYEIDVGNGENFVVIATALPIGEPQGKRQSPFSEKLKQVLGDAYMDCIKKI